MKPRIKIQEQDFEKREEREQSGEEEGVKEEKVGITKKIRKARHEKQKKPQSDNNK